MKLRLKAAPIAATLLLLSAPACVPTFGFEEGDITVDASLGDAASEGDASVDANVEPSGDAPTEAEADADAATSPVLGASCASPGALACNGHAQKLVLVCDANSSAWAALQSCDGQKLCDSRSGSCQDPAALCVGKAPGDKVCEAGASVECGPDLVTASTTACPFACAAGSCVGSCAPGTRRCAAATPEACDAKGTWNAEASCAYVCAGEGQCTGECTPNAKECVGNAPRACDASGTWQTSAPCANVCSAGVCVAACSNGAKQCNALVPEACVGGAWQTSAACPYVCNVGTCIGACSPGATRCSALVPQTCDATGAWVGKRAGCSSGIGRQTTVGRPEPSSARPAG